MSAGGDGPREPGCEAAIFDLDGVVTETVGAHERAWGETFDAFLRRRAEEGGPPFAPFTHQDYLVYVDGKPRYEGVASFLASRGIELPAGEPSDPPERTTVCGLGNRKNRRFVEVVERGGVAVYPSSVELIDSLRERGVRIGVVTASRNGRRILEATGLLPLVEELIDGEVAAERGLAGKPRPDAFVAACRALGCRPERSAVVEDALAGVRAGVDGGFGLVLGVARHAQAEELRAEGADRVVDDLAEVDPEWIERWFDGGLAEDLWSLTDHRYEPAVEPMREVLFAVGNGYFATRGAAEESRAGGVHYPGTYLGGVYDRLPSEVAGRTLEHEDLVNGPDWRSVAFRVGDGEWQDLDTCEVVTFSRRLDLRRGRLERELVLRDPRGRETRVRSVRLASMAARHLAALRYRLEPLDYRAPVTLRSGIDGGVVNAGVERYRELNGRHLEILESGGEGGEVRLRVRTVESGVEIATVARHRFRTGGELRSAAEVATVGEGDARCAEVTVELGPGEALEVEKLVAITTSRDPEPGTPLDRARRAAAGAAGFDAVAEASATAWADLWRRVDVEIEGDRLAQKLLRLHAYHLLITAGPHHGAIDAGFPARGLHGEGYRGHVFWDEAFALPFYVLHLPEIAREILRYRCRRLDRARANATEQGLPGAAFPWQSGSDGREETPALHLNPRSGEWGPDHSRLQRHVSLAVAYDLWLYVTLTGDHEFLAEEGAELVLEVARYWAARATLDPASGRWSITGVMGPDEYHESRPGAAEAGLRDNAHTNLMAAWLLDAASELLDLLPAAERRAVTARLDLSDGELERWREIAGRLRVAVSADGVIEQFDGFFDLAELDWPAYRARHGSIARLDRILKAEGDTPDRYQVLKQADALMPFYLLSMRQLERVVKRLGIGGAGEPLGVGELLGARDLLGASFDHYLPRTSHGSTLSTLVHGHLAELLGRHELSRDLFRQTLLADYADVQGGTTGEGIHAGAMAGSLVWALRLHAGVEVRDGRLEIRPRLPPRWRRLRCRFHYRGAGFRLEVTPFEVLIELAEGAAPAQVIVAGRALNLVPGEVREVGLGRTG